MGTVYEFDPKTSVAVITRDHFGDIQSDELFTILGQSGVIILRGCINTVEEFSAFVKKHSSRLSLDPARSMVGGAAQLVDAGTHAVGLHCENGNSPFWPDLTWFYCHRAPTQGSQTTICNGADVYWHLSEGCRNFFADAPIRYRRRVAGDKWRRLVCHYRPDINNPSLVSFHDLLKLTQHDPHTTITHDAESDDIHYAYVVSAIQTSSFSALPAFANSILGPSYNYEKPIIDMADGREIPEAYLDEIETITQAHTHPIGWQDHDIAMIDNRRVMHGREEILDMNRQIFNALSYR